MIDDSAPRETTNESESRLAQARQCAESIALRQAFGPIRIDWNSLYQSIDQGVSKKITLPMTTQPRILKLLDDLRDTTVSINFVPDIFVTDLIQGHVDSINGIPVVGVCEDGDTIRQATPNDSRNLLLAAGGVLAFGRPIFDSAMLNAQTKTAKTRNISLVSARPKAFAAR